MQANDQVVVIGASGFGREALDVLEAMREGGAPIEVAGVVDDAPSDLNLTRLEERGVRYLGTREDWLSESGPGGLFVLGIGDPEVRRRIAAELEQAGCVPFRAIHPSAVIGTNSVVDQSAVVCARAVISTNVRLGRYVHVNPNATIGHDAILDDFVSINPGAVISGEVHIHSGVLVGAGAVVLQQLTVDEDTIVGAAALVTKSVPEGRTVKGVPGRWESDGPAERGQ